MLALGKLWSPNVSPPSPSRRFSLPPALIVLYFLFVVPNLLLVHETEKNVSHLYILREAANNER